MLQGRRLGSILMLCASLLTAGLGIAPQVCHAEDLQCQQDDSHHTDPGCQCSCHMAAVLPGDQALVPVPLQKPLAPAAPPIASSFAPASLDRPPRR
jgi:hypothetical protein